MENIAKKLFDILSVKFDDSTIKTLDKKGNETLNMNEVSMFSFDFKANQKNYGPVVISLTDDLNIYYGDNITRALDDKAREKWDNMVQHLSNFARRNRLGFNLKNLTDLKYDLSKVDNLVESYRNIFEGYYGSRKTSYTKQGKAKIIIKHSKPLNETDKRYRYIKAIYIENADGERFKLPFKKLSGAKAMARHVTEGGNPYDLFGQHIAEMVRDINTLGGFVRRSKMYEDNEEALQLIETSRNHYDMLRKNLKKIAGKRGYYQYKESWEPSEITETESNVEAVKKLFTERSINARIEEALPLLARLQELAKVQNSNKEIEKEPTMKELNEFERWVEDVSKLDLSNSKEEINEGTWAVPTTPEEVEKLKEFLSKPQPVGIDALNATEKLYDIIGDDELFDQLADLAEDNPEADARPVVINWIKDAIKNKEFVEPEVIDNLRKVLGDIQEDCIKDLDAGDKKHLNAEINKDIDKYAKPKKVLSAQEKISESTDLNDLLVLTNRLLKG